MMLTVSATDKIMEMSTLGQQPIVLGGLYSAVHDEFLPVMKLWSSRDIEAHKDVIYHPVQNSKWTSVQTLEEKKELFGIGVAGSLKVTMGVTAIKAGGSFDYLSEKKVFLISLIL